MIQLLSLILLIFSCSIAYGEQVSPNYSIKKSIFSIVGGSSESANYINSASLSVNSSSEEAASTGYINKNGFWFNPSDTICPITSVNPIGNTFNTAQTLTLSANELSTTYYTLDGQDPTTASAVYSSPISIPTTTTFKFFSVDISGNQGQIRTELYSIIPGKRNLRVTLGGTGGGSINSNPGGIQCTSGTCNGDFDPTPSVDLYQAPDSNSLFGSWSGACNGNAGCQVTVDSDKSVTATFNYISPVNIGGSGYDSLQIAYNSAPDGTIINTRDSSFSENLTCDQDKNFMFKGGYDINYSTRPGMTKLYGKVTISKGTAVLDKISIH